MGTFFTFAIVLTHLYSWLKKQDREHILNTDLEALLLTAVRQRFLSSRSQQRRFLTMSSLASEDNPAYQIIDEQEEWPELIYLKKERKQELLKLLEDLPEDYRTVIAAHYFGGLSCPEIASITDQSLFAVKSKIQRSLRLLRKMIGQVEEGRDPAGQERLLKVLQPVVETVEWGHRQREEWNARMVAKSQGELVRKDAFMETRNVLLKGLPSYTWGVAAIGVPYSSYEAAQKDLGMKYEPGTITWLPSGALGAVLGQEFLVVDDPRWSHEDLLKASVERATDPEYRGARASFTAWQQKFLNGELTDTESIHQAIGAMRELLEQQKAIVSRERIKTAVQYSFRFGVFPATVAGALLAGLPGALLGAAASTFLSVGELTVDELFFKKAKEDQPSPAAFLYDTRKHFGWH